MTRIKICGLTRAEDVALCAALGADYVGFNFSARSPRQIAAASAPALLAASGGVWRVGVFVDEDRDAVSRAIEALRLDLLQFHRAIREEDFGFDLPVIGVRRVFGSEVPDEGPLLSRCHAVLFDTGRNDAAGGTGETFDWSVLPRSRGGAPAGLAGGLTADNVGAAIRATRPFLVDTASGVESSPGVKDSGRLRAFFVAVRSADAE
jgi:phosphoribosylanthranilate isomerase